MQQDSEGVSLEQVLGVLRRRLPLIVLCVVIVAGAAYGFSKRETKKYTTTTSVVFNVNPLSQQIAGLPAVGSSSTLLAQQADNLELVKGGDTATKTSSLLGHGLTAEKVSSSLKIASQGESGVIDISATSTSPTLAAAIANTYAQQFVSQQQSANRQYFKSALALVRKQLSSLPPRQRVSADGVELRGPGADVGSPRGTQLRQRPGGSGSAVANEPLLAENVEERGSRRVPGLGPRPWSRFHA